MNECMIERMNEWTNEVCISWIRDWTFAICKGGKLCKPKTKQTLTLLCAGLCESVSIWRQTQALKAETDLGYITLYEENWYLYTKIKKWKITLYKES